jgi:exopolysaccharide biosynthesis protein
MARSICISILCLFFWGNIFGQDLDSIAFTKLVWENKKLGKGLIWQHVHTRDSAIFSSRQNVHVVRLKKRKSKFDLGIARSAQGDLTSTMSANRGAIAGVNASFFNTKTWQSVNFVKIDGIIEDTSVTKNGSYSSHQMGVILFDEKGVDIVMRDTSMRQAWDKSLKYKNAMESGPLLILDGISQTLPSNAFNTNRHPRTCVGLTKDEIILMTVDGRTNESYGLSLFEATKVMRWLGCKEAINLDGGGSTTMFIKDQHTTGVVNMPCDNKKFDHEGERKVANALIVLPKK